LFVVVISLSSRVICYWIDVANKHEHFSMSPSIHSQVFFSTYKDSSW
jgi:hypothetical protein